MVELQIIYTHLIHSLDQFCLKFDSKIFHFFRFGEYNDDKIYLFDDDDNLTITKVSQSVRYLGF